MLHRERIELFQGDHKEQHFEMLIDSNEASSVFLYNPETILKVGKITPDEKAENLYTQQRYEEALRLCSSSNTYLLRKI